MAQYWILNNSGNLALHCNMNRGKWIFIYKYFRQKCLLNSCLNKIFNLI
jgi:hypothetical protein